MLQSFLHALPLVSQELLARPVIPRHQFGGPPLHGRGVERIQVDADPALDARGPTAVDLDVRTVDGRALSRSLDIAPGFPGAASRPWARTLPVLT